MSRIELNRKQNPSCLKGCNKEERAKHAENDLCSLVKSIDDNLPVRCVGQWGEEKIFLLHQYFGIFVVGMKNKWHLNYIEICSGPGRCINRQEGCEFDGTAIAIMNHVQFQYVKKAIFYDYDENVIQTLSQRIANLQLTNKAIAKHGDYNNPDTICADLKGFDDNSLNLIFIDPTDCSVPFSLIKRISSTLKRVDLIINVATMTDFNRNIQMAFDDPKRAEKYIRFLDDTSFFTAEENKKLCEKRDYTRLRKQFRESYMNSLKKVGFKHFDYTPINGFYDILFASSNPKGIEFWKKATKEIDSTGQRTLDFGL